MEFAGRSFIVIVIICNLYIWRAASRATMDQDEEVDEGSEIREIQLHVLTKREAVNDLEQEYPRVEGRTFRASEPLNPNISKTVTGDPPPPQNIFQTFETQNEIFQPEIDTESSVEREQVAPEDTTDQHASVNKENHTDTKEESKTATRYGAQYPYTVSGNEYRGPLPQTGTGSQGYQTDDGYQHTVTSRRVVLAGRGADTSDTGYTHSSGYDTSGGYTEYQPSQTSRSSQTPHNSESSYSSQYGSQYGSRYPGTGQVSSETRVYSGYNSGNRGTSRIPGTRTQARGPYYDGPVYVDSNGHYVDAQGRHLDSTGRYYDVSGRYQDAVMTGGQTYRHTETGTSGTSGQNLGSYSTYYNNRRYSSGSGSNGGYYDSSGRYITGSSSSAIPNSANLGSGYVDTSQSRPVDSYGGTQFYSSGRRYQTTYDPITTQISSDPNCPTTNTRVTINGLTCNNAVSQLGAYVCYNYERVSTECCERCLQVKRPENVGCEYGDRSHQCRDIQPLDCYNERNAQICCDRCRQFREQRAQSSPAGCEYGDLTPRCQTMMQRPHLCYLPENQRICCQTCPRLANTEEPNCQWGNQNPELCQPFDANRRLQLNCYMQGVQEICCATCRSLRERMRENIPGCEFGDSPVLFYSGREALDCPGYIHQYGLENCDDPEVARKCCYTCYRYRRARG